MLLWLLLQLNSKLSSVMELDVEVVVFSLAELVVLVDDDSRLVGELIVSNDELHLYIKLNDVKFYRNI